MKKKYFLSFDFWGDDFNKFHWGIYEIDLSTVELIQECRRIVCEKFDSNKYRFAEIKILAFNNIE